MEKVLGPAVELADGAGRLRLSLLPPGARGKGQVRLIVQ